VTGVQTCALPISSLAVAEIDPLYEVSSLTEKEVKPNVKAKGIAAAPPPPPPHEEIINRIAKDLK
jgi:hypothetical protein